MISPASLPPGVTGPVGAGSPLVPTEKTSTSCCRFSLSTPNPTGEADTGTMVVSISHTEGSGSVLTQHLTFAEVPTRRTLVQNQTLLPHLSTKLAVGEPLTPRRTLLDLWSTRTESLGSVGLVVANLASAMYTAVSNACAFLERTSISTSETSGTESQRSPPLSKSPDELNLTYFPPVAVTSSCTNGVAIEPNRENPCGACPVVAPLKSS